MNETGHEWWESEDLLPAITNEDEARMIVPRIVREAERRARIKAIEECMEMMVDGLDMTFFERKLEALKSPDADV